MNLIAGGICSIVVGGISFMWAAPKMDMMRSFLGQIAIGFGGQQAAGEVQLYQFAYYGGIVAMILGGVLLIAGIAKTRPSESSAHSKV